MGKNDRYAVWRCDNDRRYSNPYAIKPHISKWDQFLQMRFFFPKNENEVKTCTKLVNRVFVDSSGKKKTFQVSKYTKICLNHFEYGRPVEAAPNPILFLIGYDNDAKVGVKRKASTLRATSQKENIEEGTSMRDQKRTTREGAAARNTIRSRASPNFSIVIKQSGRTNLFNVC